MGCVIRIDSEQFISKFLKHFSPNEFQFLLISENITTNKKYKNVMSVRSLIPPPNIISGYIDDGFTKSYQNKYFDFLKKDENNSLVSIIVKAALSNMNIVLLCSKSEDEFKYLKMICEFIEKKYRLKTYNLKKFLKNPSKACKIENKDEIIGILMKSMDKIREKDIEINHQIDKDKYIKRLKKLD
jgi:hypothetical protein